MSVKMGAIAVLLSAIALTAAEGNPEQIWPKNGRVELQAGDYKITVLASGNGRLSGFSFRGRELFVHAGASAGTRYEPFQKEDRISLKVTVDGAVPAEVNRLVSGKRVVLEREVMYGDIRLFSRYALTPDGLFWSVRYKIESVKTSPKYFYLFTLPWSLRFTEYLCFDRGESKSGRLVTDGKWKINDDLQALAVYDPTGQIGAVTRIVTPIPTEIRRHAIWDHKAYHKYFLLHKRPKWEVGYESPEYFLFVRAFQASPENWQKQAESLFFQRICP